MKYDFSVADFLLGVNDSMELDSGQEVASLETDGLYVSIRVAGDVRVVFNDESYRASSQFPEELVELFHNGKAWNDERVYVDNSNWFESFVYYKNPNYDPEDKKSPKWLCDPAWCDVLDGGWENEADVFSFLLDLAKEYEKAQAEQ